MKDWGKFPLLVLALFLGRNFWSILFWSAGEINQRPLTRNGVWRVAEDVNEWSISSVKRDCVSDDLRACSHFITACGCSPDRFVAWICSGNRELVLYIKFLLVCTIWFWGFCVDGAWFLVSEVSCVDFCRKLHSFQFYIYFTFFQSGF